jgi:hypothetical protein
VEVAVLVPLYDGRRADLGPRDGRQLAQRLPSVAAAYCTAVSSSGLEPDAPLPESCIMAVCLIRGGVLQERDRHCVLSDHIGARAPLTSHATARPRQADGSFRRPCPAKGRQAESGARPTATSKRYEPGALLSRPSRNVCQRLGDCAREPRAALITESDVEPSGHPQRSQPSPSDGRDPGVGEWGKVGQTTGPQLALNGRENGRRVAGTLENTGFPRPLPADSVVVVQAVPRSQRFRNSANPSARGNDGPVSRSSHCGYGDPQAAA